MNKNNFSLICSISMRLKSEIMNPLCLSEVTDGAVYRLDFAVRLGTMAYFCNKPLLVCLTHDVTLLPSSQLNKRHHCHIFQTDNFTTDTQTKPVCPTVEFVSVLSTTLQQQKLLQTQFVIRIQTINQAYLYATY